MVMSGGGLEGRSPLQTTAHNQCGGPRVKRLYRKYRYFIDHERRSGAIARSSSHRSPRETMRELYIQRIRRVGLVVLVLLGITLLTNLLSARQIDALAQANSIEL